MSIKSIRQISINNVGLAYISYFLQYCNFTDTRGVKFDKKNLKKSCRFSQKKVLEKYQETLERSLKSPGFCI